MNDQDLILHCLKEVMGEDGAPLFTGYQVERVFALAGLECPYPVEDAGIYTLEDELREAILSAYKRMAGGETRIPRISGGRPKFRLRLIQGGRR